MFTCNICKIISFFLEELLVPNTILKIRCLFFYTELHVFFFRETLHRRKVRCSGSFFTPLEVGLAQKPFFG